MSERKPKYWLHRISHEWQVSYPLLEKGYLSIGWGEFGNKETLNNLRSNFDGVFFDEWGGITRSRFFLKNFIIGMQKGDIVVVPKYGCCEIYEIIGEQVISTEELGNLCVQTADGKEVKNENNHLTVDGKRVDLGFYWEVKQKNKGISRDKLDRKLYAKTRYLGTNLDITSVKDIVDSSIQIKSSVNKENLVAIQEYIDKQRLEDLVYWYIKAIGADYVKMPKKDGQYNRWGNADIVAFFKLLRLTLVVQVNEDNHSNNDWVIRKIMEFKEYKLRNHETSIMWLISNLDEYPKACIALAEGVVKLIGKRDFVDMLLSVEFKSL